MRILFVGSGNNKYGISPIVKAQAESLKNSISDVKFEIEYFTIIGKGYKGYLNNILRLRKLIKSSNYDIVHSHYLLSSIVATFSNPLKLVVSLMGSDVYHSKFWNNLIRRFSKRWDSLIVKSVRMKNIIGLENIKIIPNGVNVALFLPIEKSIAKQELGWDSKKKIILFASHPGRPEKNFQLAKDALKLLKEEIEFITIKDIQQEKMVYYLNACDLLLMTSKYEGSPNIIKEAMACNLPVVSTDVGDVKWLFGNEAGYYLTSFSPDDVAEKINQAIGFSKKNGSTNGRQRINELGLDSNSIAKKIINIYIEVLNKGT